MNVPLPETPRALSSLKWTWEPRTAQNLNAEKVASQLGSESKEYFCAVQFEDWVQEATGSSSSAVRSLQSKYEFLSAILYYYLRRHLDKYQKYLDVKNVLRKDSDPFFVSSG